MTQMNNQISFLVTMFSLAGTLLSLVIGLTKMVKSMPAYAIWFYASAVFACVAAVSLAVRAEYPTPTLAIETPAGTMDVELPNAGSGSVRFSVSGTSENVPFDKCIYVLVKVSSEWHVQECAEVDSQGRWSLPYAWIGDASEPINENVRVHVMAVVAEAGVERDRRVSIASQLHPVTVSPVAHVVVRHVQSQLAQAGGR